MDFPYFATDVRSRAPGSQVARLRVASTAIQSVSRQNANTDLAGGRNGPILLAFSRSCSGVDATLVTADDRYFAKAASHGHIVRLAEFNAP